MENSKQKIKIAIDGGINFGAKLTAKQLMVITKHLGDNEEIELTTFQQSF